jgi:V8-like Glu-specific endopeptidase
MMMKSLVASLPLVLAACIGAAPTGVATQPIINPDPTTDTTDTAVVMVLSQVPGSMTGSLCSGEVISPHVVLTAAHCVDPAVVGTGVKFEVFTGAVLNMTAPLSDFLAVSETHYDTAFNPQDPTQGHDLGIVILKSATTIAPIPFNRTPLGQSMVGQPARLVGYGITNPNDTTGMTAGTRRQAPSKVNSVDQTLVGFEDGSHSICEGDSGGPGFMTMGGRELIVGVTSYGFQTCPTSMPGTDTRVDAYTSFIDPYVLQFDPPAAHGGDACTKDSECTPLLCQSTSIGNVCAQACDPSAMTSGCPMGTMCTNIDGTNLCAKATPKKSGGSCALGGSAPSSFAALALVLAALLLRRRFLISG